MNGAGRSREATARFMAVLAAGCYHAAYLRSVLEEGRGNITVTLLAISLLGLPFVSELVDRAAKERLSGGLRRTLLALQALPLVFLPTRDFHLVLAGTFVLALGNLLVRLRHRRALFLCLAFAPFAVLAEMAISPGEFWIAVLPLCLVAALIGWILYSADEHSLWLERRLSPRLSLPLRRVATSRLCMTGLGVAVVVMLLAPFLYLPLLALPSPQIDGGSRSLPFPPPPPVAERAEPSGTGSGRQPTRFDGTFPGELDFAGGVTRLADEEVLEVRPSPPRRIGALYLRGVVLDTFTTGGVLFGGSLAPPPREDEDDGRRDGWTSFARREAIELEVRMRPIEVEAQLGTVLFAPRPVVAVGLPRVHHDPDGFLLHPARADASTWLTYGLRWAPGEEASMQQGAVERARYLQLPDSPAAVRWLRSYAEEVIAPAGSALERTRAVVSHFKEGFTYSLLSSDFPGLGGVLDFLQSRSGHCSYFAAAATLLLRTEGIPARIATGYLAEKWNEDEGRYEVTTRDGHAWIEVFLDGGWRTFDPTPGAARARALRASLGEEEASIAALGGSLLSDLRSWIATGDDLHLRLFRTDLGLLLEALGAPAVALVVTLVALLFLAALLRRRGRSPSASRTGRGAPRLPEDDLYRLLVTVLRELGHERRRAWTLREFLARVSAADPERFSVLAGIGEDLDRIRWGHEVLEPERREEAFRSLRALRSDV